MLNLDFYFIMKKLYKNEISSLLVEGGKLLTTTLIKNNFFNEFYLFIAGKKLKKNGLLKFKNIKKQLSKNFVNKSFNEAFLNEDNLIHYY